MIISTRPVFKARVANFRMKVEPMNLYGHVNFQLSTSKIWGVMGVLEISFPLPPSKLTSTIFEIFRMWARNCKS